MKQILQSFKTGKTELIDIPCPMVGEGEVLIKTTRSLVSLGTEKMLVEFGRASLIKKARQQPEKVKMVLDKISSDGLIPTMETVFKKLEQPLPLGYCNVGEVVAVGENVSGFKIGDRVASNGQHAEYVSVPKNLVAHIPDNVSDDEATFTVIGAIGLQGIRLLNPTMGETIVIVGLGLIGLLTAQMLIANGCNVIGIDVDTSKIQMAENLGINAINPTNNVNPVDFVLQNTDQIGADGVIITASAKSNEIISQAAQMSRKRGKIILIGVIGLDILRSDFYEKELSFQVSCSYGPGRYDENYEEKGIDYPLPYVRWTEKRNFETILELISNNRINVESLITENVPLEDYNSIYDNIGKSQSIASILNYSSDSLQSRNVEINNKSLKKTEGIVAIVGAGNFTKMTLLPALKKVNAQIKYIVSSGGVNGTDLAKKYKIANSTTDYDLVLDDPEVDMVIITTRHNLHKEMVVKALKKNKNVFVEKPLAITNEELDEIILAHAESSASLTVGYNRRFSPHIKKIKSAFSSREPMQIIATMNAGFIPQDSWIQDMTVGGGRIIGEACHYLDLIVFLGNSRIKSICTNALGENPEINSDNVSILVKLENGSTGVLNYFSNGSKAYSKERLEVFSSNQTIIMDNFRSTKGYGIKGFKNLSTKQDKGHNEQFDQLIKSLKAGNIDLISFDDLVNVTRASFYAVESIKSTSWLNINE